MITALILGAIVFIPFFFWGMMQDDAANQRDKQKMDSKPMAGDWYIGLRDN